MNVSKAIANIEAVQAFFADDHFERRYEQIMAPLRFLSASKAAFGSMGHEVHYRMTLAEQSVRSRIDEIAPIVTADTAAAYAKEYGPSHWWWDAIVESCNRRPVVA